MRDDGRVQDNGVVWRRGDVDGRPIKVIALISPGNGIGGRWR